MIPADSDHREQTAQHIYRLKIDAIKWQMRLDQKRFFEDWAKSLGFQR
jgi:hypothetical protein